MKKWIQFTYLLMFSTISINTYAGQPGYFIGGSVGKSDRGIDYIKDTNDNRLAPLTDYTEFLGGTTLMDTDNADLAFKFFAGYNFNPYFGIETSYVKLGNRNIETNLVTDAPVVSIFELRYDSDLEIDGFTLAGVASYPIFNKTNVFAKAGFFRWTAEGHILRPLGESPDIFNDKHYDNSGADLLFGAGASYQLSNNVAVRGEWERYLVEDSDFNLYSVGLQFNF